MRRPWPASSPCAAGSGPACARASSASRRCSTRSADPSRPSPSPRSAAPTARARSRRCWPRSSRPRAAASASTPRRTCVTTAERIRVDGRPISEADFVDGVEALGTLIARLDATVFEAGTALALDHFCRARVDVAVLEVGLGGRLDATTVGRPRGGGARAASTTTTRLELGDTLAAIAAEKAAIIRERGGVLGRGRIPRRRPSSSGGPREVGVPLLRRGARARASVRAASPSRPAARPAPGPDWRLDDVACGLLGVFQPGNALLAAAAARAPGRGRARRSAPGSRGARWPGRFQVFRRDPIVILDGAHNPAGRPRPGRVARAPTFPGRPVTLRDRHPRRQGRGAGSSPRSRPLAARVILTASGNPRAASPDALRGAPARGSAGRGRRRRRGGARPGHRRGGRAASSAWPARSP